MKKALSLLTLLIFITSCSDTTAINLIESRVRDNSERIYELENKMRDMYYTLHAYKQKTIYQKHKSIELQNCLTTKNKFSNAKILEFVNKYDLKLTPEQWKLLNSEADAAKSYTVPLVPSWAE